MIREQLLISILILLIGGVLGFYARPFIVDPLSPRQAEALSKKLSERNTSFFTDILKGKIVSMSSDHILLDVLGYNQIILVSGLNDVRRVGISPSTKIILSKVKDPNSFLREQEAFNHEYQSYLANGGQNIPPSPPSGSIEEEVSAEALREGMEVTVKGEGNILFSRSFQVQSINITSQQ